MCALPGLPGINPRKLQKLLKNSGLMQALSNIKLEEVPGVTKVEIYLSDGTKLVIDHPSVSKISVAGLLVFQIQTTEQAAKRVPATTSTQQAQPLDIVSPSSEEKKPFAEEDIELVMQETGCSREEAVRALEETRGDLAEAIMLIRRKRGT